MAKKVKVVGYAQRVFYNDGIEYRNFSDGLVGQQLTNEENTTFTNGNFIITSNFDAKVSRIFKTNNFSKYIALDTLTSTNNTQLTDLVSQTELTLNSDPTKLRNYALFGSLREFIRTSLEHIIERWPASLSVSYYIVNPTPPNFVGNTIENYEYDVINQTSTFTINATQIYNIYDIDYSTEGLTLATYNSTFDLRNFALNYGGYNIKDCKILEYTAVTDTNYGVLSFKTEGNPFPTITGGISTEEFHIKPNDENIETFFEGLGKFENYLLNRLTVPQYQSVFTYNTILDTGIRLTMSESFIWPTSDGYNLDFNSGDYVNFVTKLIEMADGSDKIDSDTIARFLTTASISDFDSAPDCDGEYQETTGAKVNKTLKIYGREYDEITTYIDGLSHARTISYDKKDNAPDNIVRLLGRTLGWDLTSSLVNNDILTSYLEKNETGIPGYSRGLSISEQEIEFWRRLIINTPWIWKSKGTRKVIEMFFKFIGTPNGLYRFNEYVYVVDKPLDIELFNDVLTELDYDGDVNLLNIDSDGYPRVLANNSEMYFQKAGLWYRQTGGVDADIDITTGNNPHVGPYDGGQAYLDQFGCLIPNFSSVTIHNEYVTSGLTNLYLNDSAGDFNGVNTQETVVTIIDTNGVDITDCMCVTSEIVDSPKPRAPQSNCGCDFEVDDKVLKIDFKCDCAIVNDIVEPCSFVDAILSETGVVTFKFDSFETTSLADFPNGTLDDAMECCRALGSEYTVVEVLSKIGTTYQCVIQQEAKPIITCDDYATEGRTPEGYVLFDFTPNTFGDGTTANLGEYPGITDIQEAIDCCCSLGYEAQIRPYDGQKNVWVCNTNVPCGGVIEVVPCTLVLSTPTVNGTTNGDSSGSITVTLNDGNPTYTYTLSTNSSVIETGTSTGVDIIFNGLVSGIYEVSITDADDCTWVDVIIIKDTLVCEMTFDISQSITCSTPNTIWLTNVVGVAPFEYKLDGVVIDTTSNDHFTFFNVVGGNHVVEVVGSDTCTLDSNVTFVTVPEPGAPRLTNAWRVINHDDGRWDGFGTFVLDCGEPNYDYTYRINSSDPAYSIEIQTGVVQVGQTIQFTDSGVPGPGTLDLHELWRNQNDAVIEIMNECGHVVGTCWTFQTGLIPTEPNQGIGSVTEGFSSAGGECGGNCS